ncbi:MAG: glycosyltransferase [Candidatus Cyclobacteriaceae bacterium M3_2C_046]
MKDHVYLQRYAYPHQLINSEPDPRLRTIVVIPALAEEKLDQALQALIQNNPTQFKVEVIVIVNQPRDCPDHIFRINRKAYENARELVSQTTTPIDFHICWLKDLPPKTAGVGLARKTGMDEAVRRFDQLKQLHPDIHNQAVIACFDADCTCAPNYLSALEQHFLVHTDTPGASIYFEHPLDDSLSYRQREGITKYELWLRYYVNGLRWAGYPYAFSTVGSSMAVRSIAYQKQGGMNKRKAGEDFYFLQKIFPLGGYTEINATAVYPSPRCSDRVPFGTGKSQQKWLQKTDNSFPAYHPDIFLHLQQFLSLKHEFYKASQAKQDHLITKLPSSIAEFLSINQFKTHLQAINRDSPHLKTFNKKFFYWLDGFKILKYVHYARDHFYKSPDIKDAAGWLLQKMAPPAYFNDSRQLLEKWRIYDRENSFSSWQKAYNELF